MSYKDKMQLRLARRRYEQSPLGRARRRRYERTAKGRAAERLRKKRKQEQTQAIVAAAKNVPCADCKGSFHPICMDFHHVNGRKLFSIGMGPSRHSVTALRREIAKCIVICANCHRLRHEREHYAVKQAKTIPTPQASFNFTSA